MKPVLLVIDCQNDFIRGHSLYECKMLNDALITRVKKLIEFCRVSYIPVVYTQHSINPDKSNAEYGEPEDVRACITGTDGWKIITDLAPLTGDTVVQKDKYDAFYKTNLGEMLRKLSVDTVLMCGVLTNNCVRATAEGAHYRGYNINVLTDCTGATSYVKDKTDAEIHDITLRDLRERMYATELVTMADIISQFTHKP